MIAAHALTCRHAAQHNPEHSHEPHHLHPGAQQTNLALAARIAFESAYKGNCNDADRDTLAGTVKICMVLTETHCTPDDLQLTLDAQNAMLRADLRAAQGKV